MSDIITSIVTAGVNNHATVSEEANSVQTDLLSTGVVGTITNTGGVSPATGSFAINQSATPAMTIDITLGRAYVTCVPSGQASQLLRARMTANTAAFVINANATGSTRYDWVYLKMDAALAAAPSVSANDVASIYVSRSTSNTSDNGTPPTYCLILAVVTVANGATSIVNANITDKRVRSGVPSTALAPQEAWIAPTFTNSWVNFGTPFANAQYMKDSMGFVHLNGVIKNGTMTASAFTLPVGYRPLNTLDIATVSNALFGMVQVVGDGTVIPAVGSNAWVSLCGISFKAEA